MEPGATVFRRRDAAPRDDALRWGGFRAGLQGLGGVGSACTLLQRRGAGESKENPRGL